MLSSALMLFWYLRYDGSKCDPGWAQAKDRAATSTQHHVLAPGISCS
jgi:hypothetical protein